MPISCSQNSPILKNLRCICRNVPFLPLTLGFFSFSSLPVCQFSCLFLALNKSQILAPLLSSGLAFSPHPLASSVISVCGKINPLVTTGVALCKQKSPYLGHPKNAPGRGAFRPFSSSSTLCAGSSLEFSSGDLSPAPARFLSELLSPALPTVSTEAR